MTMVMIEDDGYAYNNDQEETDDGNDDDENFSESDDESSIRLVMSINLLTFIKCLLNTKTAFQIVGDYEGDKFRCIQKFVKFLLHNKMFSFQNCKKKIIQNW